MLLEITKKIIFRKKFDCFIVNRQTFIRINNIKKKELKHKHINSTIHY